MKLGAGAVLKSKVLLEQLDLTESLCNLTPANLGAQFSAAYRPQLEVNSQNGATLTDVAGAIQWFNGDSSITSRKTYTGSLTNGTPGILDNQDARRRYTLRFRARLPEIDKEHTR